MYIRDYKCWFPLSGYKVVAQSQELERRLWEVFPQRCLSFWPYLLKDSDGMKEYLERDMPVIVDTHMDGIGNFTTKIDWLAAWVKIRWRGQIWCISHNGRMWLSGIGRPNEESAGRLVWKIPDEGNSQEGISLQAPMSGVFRSPISTEVIASFLEDFRGCKWFDDANEITWERRAGMDLFTLNITHGRQKFTLYLQREKYSGQDIGAEIDELYTRLIDEGGNHIIDATYEGKINLRKL